MNYTVSAVATAITTLTTADNQGGNFLVEWVIYYLAAGYQSLEKIGEYFIETSILALSIFALYILSGCFTYAASDKESLAVQQHQFVRKVLLIIAQPSDECKYFGPTIMRLKKENCRIYMMCISRGNYSNIREMKPELYASCNILEIPQSNLRISSCAYLKSGFSKIGNAPYLAPTINDWIELYKIDTVYTFDHVGVSGDADYRSIFYNFSRLCINEHISSDVKVYMLESVNILRAWSFIFDTYMSRVYYKQGWAADIFVTLWNESSTIQKACLAYGKKFSWKCMLQTVFSRYIYINTYRELNINDVYAV